MTDLLEFRTPGRAEVAARGPDLAAVAAEVYSAGPFEWSEEDSTRFADRLRVQQRQPGFVFVEAVTGDYVVGYAFGLPLRPTTDWWRHATTSLPPALTTERAGRTFALTELVVRAPWRRQRIGSTLHDMVLAGRGEERAVTAVLTTASAAQSASRSWGWRKVARRQEPLPGARTFDLLARDLPMSHI